LAKTVAKVVSDTSSEGFQVSI